MELLSKKLKDLKAVQTLSQTNLIQVNRLEQEASNMKQDEENLYHIIISLENNKKQYSQKYIDTLEKKNSNQVELDKLLIRSVVKKKITKSNVPFKLSLPIDNYIKIKKTKDGLNFKYSETTAILAPRAGKVVYAGDLASYGNVVIIDHGNQVRSVLLGDIATKVKKGDLLKNKQLVGYTVADLGTTKSLYFEVRKKDNSENALNWLDTENLKI
jgi:murein DD-endopeptidase MepM/ murein hydrolase activator NlpD